MARALIAALGLLAASCSSGGDGIRLQVFGDGAEIAAYRSLIEAYERTAPGEHVELIAVPKQSDHVAKLATGFSGGVPPDLFLINYRRFGQFASKGVLEPLGALFDRGELRRDDYYEQALDAFRFEGTQVCLPQNVSSLVVYWNNDLFARFGVEAPPADWTWDGFLRTARALTRDTDGDGRTDVYGVGTEPTLIRLAPFVWQAGGEVVDDTERPTRFTLLDEPAVRAMTFFIELRREHRVSPSLAEAESEDYEARFKSGRLAMLIDSRRVTPDLRAVPGLRFDVAPLPRDRERATVLHGDAYCVTKSSPRKDRALRFVTFALGPEGQELLARTGRIVPSMRSVADSDAFIDPAEPPGRSARVFLDQIEVMRRVPNIDTWNEIETRADVRVEEWYYGTEPPDALGGEIFVDTIELFPRR